MKTLLLKIFLILSFSILSTSAFALSFGEAQHYNAYVKGNLSLSGNTNVTIAAESFDLPTWNNASTSSVDADVYSSLVGISLGLSNLESNGTVTNLAYNSGIAITGESGSDVQVFSISASDSLVSYIGSGGLYDIAEGSTIIFNIAGDSISSSSGENYVPWLAAILSAFSGDDNVLFNFYEATTLDISSLEIWGSILAPLADVTLSGGQLHGTVIADSLTDSSFTLQSDNPFQDVDLELDGPMPVPEPVSILLFGSGCLMMALGRKRK